MDTNELLSYILSRKYTDSVAFDAAGAAIEQAVAQAKQYTDQMATEIEWKTEIVDTLPATNPDPHTIYFVPATVTPENDGYIEYMWIRGKNNKYKWEVMGRTTAEYIIDPETLKLENNVLSIRVIPEAKINELF